MDFGIFRRRAYAILIDSNNTELAGLTGGYRAPRLINYPKLLHAIQTRVRGMKAIYKGVFVRVDLPRPDKSPQAHTEWMSKARAKWKESGFEFEPRAQKDIDSWIVSQMWAIADSAVHTHKCKKLHYVIASGDGVFARELKKIIAQYEDRLTVSVSVYSWNSGTSKQLIELAGIHNVIPLETISGLERKRESVQS